MLTVAEAAKRANRDPETVRRWIRAGKLTSWKVGNQHMIDEDDLADAIGGETERAEAAHRIGEVQAAYADSGPDRAVVAPGRGAVTDDWLPAIVGRIARAVDPVRIILFGSRVRGEAHPDADYELLVILDGVGDRRASRIAVRRSFADVPVPADIIVASVDEIEGRVPGHPSGAVYWALQEGRQIYDRGELG